MAIIQKFSSLLKKKMNFLSILDVKILQIQKLNLLILISFLIFFSTIAIVVFIKLARSLQRHIAKKALFYKLFQLIYALTY